MADIRGKVQQKNLELLADSRPMDIRTTRKGELIVVRHGVAAGFEGRLYCANFGSVTTPLATAATTAIAAQRPMAWLRVPSTATILPLYCGIVVESTGITTQGEIAVAVTSNDVGNGTSAAATTAATPINPLVNTASLVVARQLATANVTAETGYLELQRFSFAASAVDQRFVWEPMEWLPPLPGPATFAVYIGGNSVNFFCQMVWIEGPPELGN